MENKVYGKAVGRIVALQEVVGKIVVPQEVLAKVNGTFSRGVKEISLSEEGDLYFILTDNTEAFLGNIRGPQGIPGLIGPVGPQGKEGPEGADGFSPIVEIIPIDGGTRVVITDKEGNKTFDIPDGKQGPVGPTGLTGPEGPQGPTGETGKTPNIQIGEVVTLEAGTEATASITGTPEEPRLNLGIPKGNPGEPGEGGNAEVTAESIEAALGYKPANENDIPTIPANVSAFENDAGYITKEDIPAAPEVPVQSVNGKNGAVQLAYGDVGAEKAGAVSEHNVDGGAHNDIRIVLNAVKASLEAFLDIDEPTFDQLSELIAKIQANSGTIEQLTNGKVNVADIVNDLVTNAANKPLSAAQGVVLKGFVDELTTVANNAKSKADTAYSTATSANSQAGSAYTAANGAKATAQAASYKVNELEERMDNGEFVGERGTGVLKVATSPKKNVIQTAGKYYYISLATILSEAKVENVLVGDTVLSGYYIYPVGSISSDTVYLGDRTSIQGEKGADGAAGKNGTSVTVQSVSESAADGGNNVVTFSDGKTLNVKNGTKGSNGAAGTSVTVSSVVESTESGGTNVVKFSDGNKVNIKNGLNGKDGTNGTNGKDGKDGVITAEDIQEIKSAVISQIITQEAGESESLVMSQKAVTDLVADALGTGGGAQYETVDSIEEMTDTSKQYVLSTDGFIYAYVTETKTIEHEAPNKFVASEAQINKRMGSSSLSTQNGYVWSGAIPVDLTKESPFRVKVEGTKITEPTTAEAFQKLWLCADTTGTTKLSAAVLVKGDNSANYAPLSADGIIHADYKGGAKLSSSIISQTKYLRIGFKFSDSAIANTSALSGVKITFPSDAYTEEVEVSEWKSTGLVPETGGGGGGNYVTLLAKVNENTSDINEVSRRVTALESGSDTITVPSFWQNAVDACIAKIKALQKNAGINAVTFPFFSDNHTRNGYAGVLIKAVMDECHIPYAFFGGDSIDSGYIADEATMIAQDKAFDTAMSYIPNGRFCRAVGNHDGYWQTSAGVKNYYTRAQVYDLFLREEGISQEKHFGADGTYYYIDDIASKVRFIVLNTNGGSVDSTQISWLQNTALSFNESGWSVVFISHQPISNHYHANISNAAEVRTVVANYMNGSSANKADVVGWFSGHIHRDRIYTGVAVNTSDDSIGAAMPFKQVTITSDHTSIAYDDATKHTVANDDKSHAIDFVTINKATRTVNLTRLGIGEDRSFTY